MAAAASKPSRARARVAVALTVIAGLLVPLSIAVTWAKRELLDTDRYIATVTPLAEDEVIIEDLAVRLQERLSERAQVDEYLAETLPSQLQVLAAPLASAFERLAGDVIRQVLHSDAFREVWVAANQAAHEQVVALLTGEGSIVDDEGRVVLDLSPIADRARIELIERGMPVFERVPIGSVALRYELVSLENVGAARDAVDLLERITWVLVALSVVAVVGAVAIAVDRRRAARRTAVAVVIGCVVLALGIAVGRSLYLDAVPDTVSPDVARRVFDILVRELRLVLRVAVIVGAVVWLALSPRLANVRGRSASAVSGIGGLGPAVTSHAGALQWVGVALILAYALTRDSIGVVTLLVGVALAAAWVLVVRGIARAASSAEPVRL